MYSNASASDQVIMVQTHGDEGACQLARILWVQKWDNGHRSVLGDGVWTWTSGDRLEWRWPHGQWYASKKFDVALRWMHTQGV